MEYRAPGTTHKFVAAYRGNAGENPVTGLDVFCTLRRMSDDKYYNWVTLNWDTVLPAAWTAQHKTTPTEPGDGTRVLTQDHSIVGGSLEDSYVATFVCSTAGHISWMSAGVCFTNEVLTSTRSVILDNIAKRPTVLPMARCHWPRSNEYTHVRVYLEDTNGAPATGVTWNAAGMAVTYQRPGTAEATWTLTSAGWVELGGGFYDLVASGNIVAEAAMFNKPSGVTYPFVVTFRVTATGLGVGVGVAMVEQTYYDNTQERILQHLLRATRTRKATTVASDIVTGLPAGTYTVKPTFSCVIKVGAEYWMYSQYRDASGKDRICRSIGTDGINFVWDQTVLQEGGVGYELGCRVPFVWAEGATYYMFFTGHRTTNDEYCMCLMTSADGVAWTPNAGNPVIRDTAAGSWSQYNIEGGGIIKSGSTYYFYGSTIARATGNLGGEVTRRRIGLWTSTNLTSWTADPRNPIFDAPWDQRFCVNVFYYGSSGYFMLVPVYHTFYQDSKSIELWQSPDLHFYPENRRIVRIVMTDGQAEHYPGQTMLDTPFLYWEGQGITRALATQNPTNVRMYYATSDSSSVPLTSVTEDALQEFMQSPGLDGLAGAYELETDHGSGDWDLSASEVWTSPSRTLTSWLNGTKTVTIVVHDGDGADITSCPVKIVSGSTILLETNNSSSDATLVVNLDAGTYTVTLGPKSGYTFANPYTLTVTASATQSHTLVGTKTSTPAAPASVDLCRVYAYMKYIDGANAGQPVGVGVGTLEVADIDGVPTGTTVIYGESSSSGATDANGYVYIDIVRGATVSMKATYPYNNPSGTTYTKTKIVSIVVPDATTYNIGSLFN